MTMMSISYALLVVLSLLCSCRIASSTYTLSSQLSYARANSSIDIDWTSDVSPRPFQEFFAFTLPSESSSCPLSLSNNYVEIDRTKLSGRVTFSLPSGLNLSTYSIALYQISNVSSPFTKSCTIDVPSTRSFHVFATQTYDLIEVSSLNVEVIDPSAELEAAALSGYSMYFSGKELFANEWAYAKIGFNPKATETYFAPAAHYQAGVCEAAPFLQYKEITVETWFRNVLVTDQFTQTKGCCWTFFSIYNDDSSQLMLQMRDGGNPMFTTYILSDGPEGCSTLSLKTADLRDNTWHHIAGTVDSTGMKLLYVDGELVASVNCSSSGAFSSSSLGISGKTLLLGAGDLDFFEGWLDETRVWSVARTQAQIKSTMNRKLAMGERNDLEIYYSYDDNSNPLYLRDEVSGKFTLALGLDLYYDNHVASYPQVTRRAPHFVPSDAPAFSERAPVILRRRTTINSSPQMLYLVEPSALSSYLTASGHSVVAAANDRIVIESLPSSSVCELYTDLLLSAPAQLLVEYSPSAKFYCKVGTTAGASSSLTFRYISKISGAPRASALSTLDFNIRSNESPIPGSSGRMLYCDGSDDFGYAKDVRLELDASGRHLHSHTIEFWALFEDSPQRGTVYSFGDQEVRENWCVVQGWYNESMKLSGCNGRYLAHIPNLSNDAEIDSGWAVNNGSGQVSLPVGLYHGSWTHFAIVTDYEDATYGPEGTFNIYVNGVLKASKAAYPSLQPTLGMYVCHWPFWGSGIHVYRGFLDEFRVWDHARTLSQIQDFMHLSISSTSSSSARMTSMDVSNLRQPVDYAASKFAGLVVYYPFNELATAENSLTTITGLDLIDPSNTKSILLSSVSDYSGSNHTLIFGGCTPNYFPYCTRADGTPCLATDLPRRPCYATATKSVLEESRPVLYASTAPVGGYFNPVESSQGSNVSLTLTAYDADGDTLQYTIKSIPSASIGILVDASNNVTLSVGDRVAGNNVRFFVSATGGGSPYTFFEYAVNDGEIESTQTMRVVLFVKCSAGSFLNPSINSCISCSAGSYKNSTDYSTQCSKCPLQSFASTEGSSTCLSCPTGFFSNTEGASQCKSCEAEGYPSPCVLPPALFTGLELSLQYDGGMVVVGYVIAVFASWISLLIIEQSVSSKKRGAVWLPWIAASSFLLAFSGEWCMSFIILASMTTSPARVKFFFDPTMSLISIPISFVIVFIAQTIVITGPMFISVMEKKQKEKDTVSKLLANSSKLGESQINGGASTKESNTEARKENDRDAVIERLLHGDQFVRINTYLRVLIASILMTGSEMLVFSFALQGVWIPGSTSFASGQLIGAYVAGVAISCASVLLLFFCQMSKLRFVGAFVSGLSILVVQLIGMLSFSITYSREGTLDDGAYLPYSGWKWSPSQLNLVVAIFAAVTCFVFLGLNIAKLRLSRNMLDGMLVTMKRQLKETQALLIQKDYELRYANSLLEMVNLTRPKNAIRDGFSAQLLAKASETMRLKKGTSGGDISDDEDDQADVHPLASKPSVSKGSSIDLKLLLNHPVCLEILKDEVSTEHNEESIMMYLEARRFRLLCQEKRISKKERAQLANALYINYIHPGSPHQVNISNNAVIAIAKNLGFDPKSKALSSVEAEQKVSTSLLTKSIEADLFLPVEQEMFVLIETNTIMRLKKEKPELLSEMLALVEMDHQVQAHIMVLQSRYKAHQKTNDQGDRKSKQNYSGKVDDPSSMYNASLRSRPSSISPLDMSDDQNNNLNRVETQDDRNALVEADDDPTSHKIYN